MGLDMLRAEYPRPQLKRKDYTILNGKWDFTIPAREGAAAVVAQIEVPFCPESRLGGVEHTDFITECEYARKVTLRKPEGRLWLNFGAVDYEASVYVNGKLAGRHRGGYTPFGFDIAPLVEAGENEIRVKVRDDVREGFPSGKQSAKRESFGCFYTRTTGIWQTVWLEETPLDYIRTVRYFPDVNACAVTVELDVEGEQNAKVEVFYGGRPVGCAEGPAKGRTRFTINLSEKHLWECGNGLLYDVTVRYGADEVASYFGLREVRYEGRRFLLNGECVFQRLVLDQGYYPDGVYTAPDEQSLVADIKLAMKLGFNGARLHQKVFEPLYLYHCDRLGFLVWGEFPSWGVEYDDLAALGDVIGEWAQEIERDFNHPCIVTWCPLNETWEKLSDERRIRDPRFIEAVYAATKRIDPTRPCVDVSGGYHGAQTDVYDFHCYHDPERLKAHLKALTERDELVMDKTYAPDWTGEKLRYGGEPVNASEYGGATIDCGGDGWGYRAMPASEFVSDYEKLTKALLACEKLSGFCYTQLYDIEQEKNGLLTYGRQSKLSPAEEAKIASINRGLAAIEKAAGVTVKKGARRGAAK